MRITHGHSGWVRVDDFPAVQVFVRYVEPGVVGELFMASADGKGITAADLRGLPLAKITAVALARPDLFKMWTQEPPEVDLWGSVARLAPPSRFVRRTRVTLSPPSARGLDDEFLQTVAAAYTSAVDAGERPNKALAEQVGHFYATGPKRGQPNTRTVERWVYLARKRGFLPTTRKGAVG